MKRFILMAAAGLLAAACEKAEEKPAAAAEPQSEKRRRPPGSTESVPAGTAIPSPLAKAAPTKPAVPPPTPEEVTGLMNDLETLAKQVEALGTPATDGNPGPDFEDIEKEYRTMTQRRSALMAGMTIDEKREFARRYYPFMQRISPKLTKYRIDRMRENSAARRAAAAAGQKAGEQPPAGDTVPPSPEQSEAPEPMPDPPSVPDAPADPTGNVPPP